MHAVLNATDALKKLRRRARDKPLWMFRNIFVDLKDKARAFKARNHEEKVHR